MVRWRRALGLVLPLLLMPAVAWAYQEGGSGLIQTGVIEEPFLLRLGRGALAMAVILVVLWRFSPKRKSIDWTLVAKGVGLQFVFALLVLKTTWGRGFFSVVNDVFIALISYTLAGARFVFGSLVDYSTPVTDGEGIVEIGANFAFAVLPTIIFFSALMTVLYYLGVMQWIVKGVAWVMQRTLKTSGAETTSAAGNIFVGQTEAPLLVKPFVKDMTLSELMAVMSAENPTEKAADGVYTFKMEQPIPAYLLALAVGDLVTLDGEDAVEDVAHACARRRVHAANSSTLARAAPLAIASRARPMPSATLPTTLAVYKATPALSTTTSRAAPGTLSSAPSSMPFDSAASATRN